MKLTRPLTAGIGAAALACAVVFFTRAPKNGIGAYRFEPHRQEPVDAELGRFSVPERRGREGSRSIQLAFVRFKSTAENPGSPIVYLAGGPGGSGISTARGTRFPLFMALREHADVIAFDQRGTGMLGFEELDCDERFLIPLDEPAERKQAGRIIAKATHGCIERLRASGVDLSAYNTRESAADLAALRDFLGVEKISLWGISYGTHLALATARYHEEIIDRMILAGIEGPAETYKLPRHQQDLIEEIARIARKDPAVSAVVPDPLGSIEKLLAELSAEPKTVRLAHPLTGKEEAMRVGAFDLQFALASMLRGPDAFGAMVDVIARLEQGDWVPLALAAARMRTGEGLHGMTLAMDCSSGASADRLNRIAREAGGTLLGDAINAPFPEVCEGQGIEDAGDAFREPVVSNLPVLLISGTLDGRTPVANGRAAAVGLVNAHHLILEGAGHGDPLFLSSPKILEAMHAFLRGEPVPYDRIALAPVRLVTPRRVIPLDEAALTRYVGDYRIGDNDVRRVLQVGGLLWTMRTGGPPFPIRPVSETEFFYEGSASRLTFTFGTDGEVTEMVMYANGRGEGVPAPRVR